jgi:RNA-directed DNA polymerase
METQLTLLSQIAQRDKQVKLMNLIRLLNEENLKDCFYQLQKNKAVGVDGVTFQEYESNLERNLQDLVNRLKSWSYHPKPVRRVYIPKSNGKWRPIGIPSLEDKIVQMAVKRILEAIYETVFLPCSFGFRPKKGAHQAIETLNTMIRKERVNCILDADIQDFFGSVHHKILLQALQVRIGDRQLIRLIVRFLKAGVMEEGIVRIDSSGAPQGGVLSPVLSNVYLHYVLDTWLVRYSKKTKGFVGLIRYCDDFVVGVQCYDEGEQLLKDIRERFRTCGLTLSEKKTHLITFGRFGIKRSQKTGNKPDTFDFLGFTHYQTVDRQGFFRVGRKTNRKRFNQSIRLMKQWIQENRNRMKIHYLWKLLSAKLMGHYLYYGIGGNSRSIQRYHHEVEGIIFKWLNRRSQRKSFNWKEFHRYLVLYPLPKPKIYHPYE